jgi:hypothetical protein
MAKEKGTKRLASELGIDESVLLAALEDAQLRMIAAKVNALVPNREEIPEIPVDVEAKGLYCSGTMIVDGLEMPCDWTAPMPEFTYQRYKAEGSDGRTFGEHNVAMHKQTASLIVIP